MKPAADSEKFRGSNDHKTNADLSQTDAISNTTVAPAIDDVEKQAQADLKPDESPQQETRKI